MGQNFGYSEIFIAHDKTFLSFETIISCRKQSSIHEQAAIKMLKLLDPTTQKFLLCLCETKGVEQAEDTAKLTRRSGKHIFVLAMHILKMHFDGTEVMIGFEGVEKPK